jgi:hypothetical protein
VIIVRMYLKTSAALKMAEKIKEVFKTLNFEV